MTTTTYLPYPAADFLPEDEERINSAVWDKLDAKWKREEAAAFVAAKGKSKPKREPKKAPKSR